MKVLFDIYQSLCPCSLSGTVIVRHLSESCVEIQKQIVFKSGIITVTLIQSYFTCMDTI